MIKIVGVTKFVTCRKHNLFYFLDIVTDTLNNTKIENRK